MLWLQCRTVGTWSGSAFLHLCLVLPFIFKANSSQLCLLLWQLPVKKQHTYRRTYVRHRSAQRFFLSNTKATKQAVIRERASWIEHTEVNRVAPLPFAVASLHTDKTVHPNLSPQRCLYSRQPLLDIRNYCCNHWPRELNQLCESGLLCWHCLPGAMLQRKPQKDRNRTWRKERSIDELVPRLRANYTKPTIPTVPLADV